MDDILKRLLLEENELQFSCFDENTAWEIGSALVQRAVTENLSFTVDISRGEHQVFHASRPGTSADNDEWVKRKTRLVNRFGHSSFYVGRLLKSMGKSLEEVFCIPESAYAPHGGCFPIRVKGTGVVGTIAISGLTQEDDHRLVTEAIKDYITNHS